MLKMKKLLLCFLGVALLLMGCAESSEFGIDSDGYKGILLYGLEKYQAFNIQISEDKDVTLTFGKEHSIRRQSDGGMSEIVALNSGILAAPESRSDQVHLFDKKSLKRFDSITINKDGKGYASRLFADNEKNLLYVQDAQRDMGIYTLIHVFDQNTYEEVATINSKGSMNEYNSFAISEKYIYLLITNGRMAGFKDVDDRYLLRVDRETFETKEIFIKEFKYQKNEDDKEVWLAGDVECYDGKIYLSMHKMPPEPDDESPIGPLLESKIVVLDETYTPIKEISVPVGENLLTINDDKLWILQKLGENWEYKDNNVYVYDLKTDKYISEFSGIDIPVQVEFIEKMAFIPSARGEILVVDTETYKEVKRIPVEIEPWYMAVFK